MLIPSDLKERYLLLLFLIYIDSLVVANFSCICQFQLKKWTLRLNLFWARKGHNKTAYWLWILFSLLFLEFVPCNLLHYLYKWPNLPWARGLMWHNTLLGNWKKHNAVGQTACVLGWWWLRTVRGSELQTTFQVIHAPDGGTETLRVNRLTHRKRKKEKKKRKIPGERER